VPLAIEYVLAKDPEYGSWDEPIWFLMKTRRKDAMEAIESVVAKAEPQRSGETLRFIVSAITGDLWGDEREPAGCVEICPALVAGMERAEYTGGSINDVEIRIKDSAAKALVLLREGPGDGFGDRFAEVNPELFNELEPDEAKRDAQIEALKEWYREHKEGLTWDAKNGRLALKMAKD
jgi:hypothetical protein